MIRHVCCFICDVPHILSNSHSTVVVFPVPGGPYRRRCCNVCGSFEKRVNIVRTLLHSGDKSGGTYGVTPIAYYNFYLSVLGALRCGAVRCAALE